MKFSKYHVWINRENTSVGISDFAQKSLGDIVFIELPEEGQVFSEGEKFGSIESVKSVSELYAPVAMKVIEINEQLVDEPEIINSDPYNEGWILKIEILEEKEVTELMSEGEYLQSITE